MLDIYLCLQFVIEKYQKLPKKEANQYKKSLVFYLIDEERNGPAWDLHQSAQEVGLVHVA